MKSKFTPWVLVFLFVLICRVESASEFTNVSQLLVNGSAADITVYEGDTVSITVGIDGATSPSTVYIYDNGSEINDFPGTFTVRTYTFNYQVLGAGQHHLHAINDEGGGRHPAAGFLTITAVPSTIPLSNVTLACFTYTGATQTTYATDITPPGATYSFSSGTSSATNAGVYNVVVAGTGAFSGSVNASWTISKADQSSTWISPDNASIQAGQSISFVAGGGAAGSYSWTGDGASGGGSSKTVLFETPGTYYVFVSDNGDSNWNPSNTAVSTITVSPAIISISSLNAANTTYTGSNQTPTFSSSPSDATFSWSVDGGTSSSTAINAGTYSIQWNATGGFTGSGIATWLIDKATQPVVNITSNAVTTYGAPYTATASGGAGAGAIVWLLGSGSTATGAAIDSSTGLVTASSSGTVVIKAYRAGDLNFYDSAVTSDFVITVNPRNLSIALSGSRVYNSTQNWNGLSAVPSGLAPGDSLWSLSTLSSSVGNYTSATAVQIRNGSNADVTSSYFNAFTGSYTITKATAPSVSISPVSQIIVPGTNLTFTGTGSTTGSYSWSGTAGASGSGNTKSLNFPNLGNFTVTVQDPGNGNYNPSVAASATISVVAAISTYSGSSSLNFGPAYADSAQAARDGGSTSQTSLYVVTNTGNVNMLITSAAFSGTNPADFTVQLINGSAPTYPVTVAPGGIASLLLRYSPSSMASFGFRSAILTISNSSGNSPAATVALSGTALLGGLSTNAGALRSMP